MIIRVNSASAVTTVEEKLVVCEGLRKRFLGTHSTPCKSCNTGFQLKWDFILCDNRGMEHFYVDMILIGVSVV